MSDKSQWFDVDKAGLGKQAEEQGKGRLIGELVQNALDEVGRHADRHHPDAGPRPSLGRSDGRGRQPRRLPGPDARLHAVFAAATSEATPNSVGNSTLARNWSWRFARGQHFHDQRHRFLRPEMGRIEKPRQKRDRGSIFQGRIRMTREEYPQVCDYLRSLLLPEERGGHLQRRPAPAPQAHAHVRGQPGNADCR